MLTFGWRKPFITRGYTLLTGAALFGGSFSESTAIWALGVVLSLILIIDLASGWRRPVLDIQVKLAPCVDVGVPAAIELTIAQPAQQGVLIQGRDPNHLAGHVLALGDATGRSELTITGRGNIKTLDVQILSDGILGIVGVRHRGRLALPHAVAVVPPAVAHATIDEFIDQLENALAEPAVLGVRPYAPGDRRRDVHWRSTARTGDLMVRERLRLDADVSRPVVISVVTENPAVLERGLAQARHAIHRCLALGLDLRLEIPTLRNGKTDVTIHPVSNELQAMQRVAGAVPSNRPGGPVPHGAAVIRIGREIACIAHG